MKYINIPNNIKVPFWVESMCKDVDGTGNYHLFSIAIDFNYASRKCMGLFWKWKVKLLIKKLNKTDAEYLKLIQIATHFWLVNKYLTKRDVIYNSTTDFYEDVIC